MTVLVILVLAESALFKIAAALWLHQHLTRLRYDAQTWRSDKERSRDIW